MDRKGVAAASLVVMVALAIAIAVPAAEQADAEGGSDATITNLGEFLKAVEDSNYVYDGHGKTVMWSPSSACTNNTHSVASCPNGLPAADGDNAQRIQEPNAQYWVFAGAGDVSISNVNFVFIPADFELCMNSSFGGDAKAESVRNAELQFQNSGDLALTNCTFDKVIVAPYGSSGVIGTTTIDGCSFENVYDAYAVKDIHSVDAAIKDSRFDNCAGGIYFSGSNEKGTYTISDNTFTNMDRYAKEGKEGTRGLIQLSSQGDYSNSDLVIENNTYSGDTPVFRQLNDTVTSAVLDVEAVERSNSFDAGVSFTSNGGVRENGTYYVDTTGGNDANNGTAVDTPFKSMKKAIKTAKAGDTIMVIGILKHTDTNGLQYETIDKPLNIVGYGDSKVPVTSGINLPKANGTVSFSNFSFDGASTFGAYDKSLDYKGLDLVIEGCDFTHAGGNCVYIQPEIGSLTVRGCHFISDNTTYEKQYLIWAYRAGTVTIEDNDFEASGHIRAPIHLGDGHSKGTTAVIRGNTVSGFERGIQLAFTNTGRTVSNSVTIENNVFRDIQISSDSTAESYEFGVVFIHESMKETGTTVSYVGNSLTGAGDRIFYSENKMAPPEVIVETFYGNTVNGRAVDDVCDASCSMVQITADGDIVLVSNGQGLIQSNGSYSDVELILADHSTDPSTVVSIRGAVSAGPVSVSIASLRTPTISGSIGILLTYSNMSPVRVIIQKIIDAEEGRELIGCDVYYFADDGSSGKVENVEFNDGTVVFTTDHCTEYDFVPIYRSVIPVIPDDDEDIPYIPPAPSADNSVKNDDESKKVAAVAVASVAAAILAAFIIMDYRKN